MKIDIKEIKFDFSGVRICTADRLTSYKREFVLAAAGPTVNFALIVIIMSWFKANGVPLYEVTESINEFWEGGKLTMRGAVGFFALCSLLQGGVNLLPVNTFDGGRMLYCAIAEICAESTASRVISVSSAAAAFALWTVSLYLMLKISAGLGIYVFAACIFFSTIKCTEWE
jgi:Zn-dependent protease